MRRWEVGFLTVWVGAIVYLVGKVCWIAYDKLWRHHDG